ncbi:hypothetical protein BK729_13110 [Bacillus thuringiensis serovar wratislaviensis]|nr:hypothetical protein BK729_13110 [Bacillus thuringiensis serovar wratislaviensis]OUB59105.1 hypothetical protein BK743_13015 [Bacillus thuringiensis serovar sylvestriensis]
MERALLYCLLWRGFWTHKKHEGNLEDLDKQMQQVKKIEYEIIHTLKHSFPIVLLCEIARSQEVGITNGKKEKLALLKR